MSWGSGSQGGVPRTQAPFVPVLPSPICLGQQSPHADHPLRANSSLVHPRYGQAPVVEELRKASGSPADADPHASCLFQSPPLKTTAASNTEILQGPTFVVSEVSGGWSQTIEALGLFLANSIPNCNSGRQVSLNSFGPIKEWGMRKCFRLVDTTHNSNTETSTAGQGIFRRPGAVHDNTQEISWESFCREM